MVRSFTRLHGAERRLMKCTRPLLFQRKSEPEADSTVPQKWNDPLVNSMQPHIHYLLQLFADAANITAKQCFEASIPGINNMSLKTWLVWPLK